MSNAGAQKIRVLIVDDNAEMREQLETLMSMEPDLEVVGKAVDGLDGIQLATELRPDIVTMDINMKPDLDGLQTAARIKAAIGRIGVIMLSVQHNPEYLRQALQAGACDYLIKPPKPDELFNAIRRCYQSLPAQTGSLGGGVAPPPPPPQKGGYLVAVYGPKGGVGTTTVASSVAVGLARSGYRVALVDADLQFGDIGIFLTHRAKNTLADLPPSADDLDIETIELLMSTHESSGMRVLLAPLRPEEADFVQPGSLKALLGILKEHYEYVVVDTSTVVNDELLAVFDSFDRLLVVSTPDIPSLKSVSVFYELLDQLEYPTEDTLFILNRLRQRGITSEQVQGYLKREVVGRISEDIQHAIRAVNDGKALINQDHNKCVAVAGLVDLVRAVEAEFAPQGAEAEPVQEDGGRRRGLFG